MTHIKNNKTRCKTCVSARKASNVWRLCWTFLRM